MYRSIICIAAAILFAYGCGQKHNNTDPHEGHDHASHSHETQADPHEGHDHSAHEGHDHSAHSHEEDGHSAHQHEDEGHSHAAEISAQAAQQAYADEIIFPKAQAALTDFKVEAVTCSPFSEVIKTSGQILSAQGDQVCLSAPVSGILSFGNVKLTDGSPVSQGQSLFYISSKHIASGDSGAKIEAAYIKAKAEYERAEKLLADRIVSQKEYDQARFDYLQAKAEYDAIAGVYSAKGTAVVVPVSGYITSLDVHEGDFVDMGQKLSMVSRNRRLELRADVSQKYYSRLKDTRSARLLTPYGDQVLSLDDMNGRLVSVGQATAGSGYMVPVIFEFDNPGGLVSGSYVEVFLLGKTKDHSITLPVSAISEQQGTFYVYVQLDEEGYQRRKVALGASDGQRIEILRGLKEGERVVTRGVSQVRMAAASGAIPHGHTH